MYKIFILLIFILLIVFVLFNKKEKYSKTSYQSDSNHCNIYHADISKKVCVPINKNIVLQSDQLKQNHLYLEYFSREPTIKDNDSGGNYLKWILNQVRAMIKDDILIMQTDFFNFDDDFNTELKNACLRGAFIYLIIDRWQVWGCPYPNNWNTNSVKDGNCGIDGKTTNTYKGRLPSNNECISSDSIINTFKDTKNFIIIDLVGGCGGDEKQFCKNCPNYSNKPSIDNNVRGNPLHTHRKIISFYSQNRNIGSIYKGSENVQTDQKGTQGVREIGWGITGLLNDPFMKGHIQHDLDTIKWFFPGKEVQDYNYKIKENQTEENKKHYDLSQKLLLLGCEYPKDGYVTVTLNWTTPDFRNIDFTHVNTMNWISGSDPNVKVWLGINPIGNKQVNPIGTFDDTVDLFGNKNISNITWNNYQTEMINRTKQLTWDNKSSDFASGSNWGGSLIIKMLQNAIVKKSKYVKIHMYNYFSTSFRPCSDNTGLYYDENIYGYSNDGISGKDIDKDKIVASLLDPLPLCNSVNVDDDSWHENLQPEFVRALYDYMDANVGQLFVVSGVPMINKDQCISEYCSKGKTKCLLNTDCLPIDFQSYLLLQLNKAGPQYDTGASKNQWWRWYTLNQKATCDSENPNTGQFCKSHEKLWFTDSDILISSGHPTRGYYSDFNSVCDDILFENAYSLVDAYNNMYNRIWSKHSVGPIFTEGKNNLGPTNPNWGKWSGSNINTLSWKPEKDKSSLYPMDIVGCSACFGTIDSNGYCNNKNSSNNINMCMYNLNDEL